MAISENRKLDFVYTERESNDVCLLEDGSMTLARLDSAYLHRAEGVNDGFELSHPNYLHTKFLNIKREGEQLVVSERIYEYFDECLPCYVNNLGRRIQPHSGPRYGREEEIKNVLPEIKDIIRSMISFVVYIHSKGLGFKNQLDYNVHFGVLGGVMKFWRVSFSRADCHNDRKKDFVQIVRIIREGVLGGIEEPLPECLEDLLQLMHLYPIWTVNDMLGADVGCEVYSVEVESFFLKHISLMSCGQRLSFVMKSYNKIEALDYLEYNRFKKAVSSMGSNTNWVEDRLEGAFIILYTSIYHGLLKDERRGQSVHAREALKEVLATPLQDYYARVRRRYPDDSSARGTYNVNHDIINVSRNVATHSYGIARELSLSNLDDSDIVDEDVEIDAAIMQAFGDLLLLLQKELYKRGLLPLFME